MVKTRSRRAVDRLWAVGAALLAARADGFAATPAGVMTRGGRMQRHVVQAAAGDRQMVGDALDGPRPSSYEPPVVDNVQLTDAWELDCYSRPVVGRDGKKLWELLVCDSSGAFRHVEPIPANKVNSREVRKRVEQLIEDAEVRPRTIRFFRRAMFNMLNIAMDNLGSGIKVKPSRSTYTLYQWLEEREALVYPKMTGYKKTAKVSSLFDVTVAERMPDVMRADQFAFVSLPLSEIIQGGVNDENIGCGNICPIPPGLPEDAMVSGVLFLTKRSDTLARWVAGSELSFMKADLKRREMLMEVGLSTSYLMARLNEQQRLEGQAFEAAKAQLKGLHFVGIQGSAEDDEVSGFWLLREMDM